MEKKNHGFTLISALIMLILVTIIGSIIFLSVKINQTIDAAHLTASTSQPDHFHTNIQPVTSDPYNIARSGHDHPGSAIIGKAGDDPVYCGKGNHR